MHRLTASCTVILEHHHQSLLFLLLEQCYTHDQDADLLNGHGVSVSTLYVSHFLCAMTCKCIEWPIFDTLQCVHRNAEISPETYKDLCQYTPVILDLIWSSPNARNVMD